MKINRLSLAAALIISIATPSVWASDWDAYLKNGHRSPVWDSYVESGFTAFDSGNLGPAELFLQRAVARGCSDGLVYLKIGLFNEAKKNYKQAIASFQKAYDRLPASYPNHPMAKKSDVFLGRVLFLNGQKEEAIPHLQKAIAQEEDFTSLYFLGQIERDKRNFAAAAKLFERSLRTTYPEGTSPAIGILIMTDIAKCYFELKNFDPSLDWWNKILMVDPANATAISYKNEIEKQKFKEREKKMIEEIVK